MKQMFRHVLSMLIAVMISLVFCTCCLSTASAADEKGRQLSITWMSPEGYSTQVALRTAGLTMCLVRMGGTDRWIPTSELSWETNTTYEERVAYINAPSTGRVTMRKTEKPKSLILQKIPTGRIALVFDKGDQYSGVYCDGMGGYVLTSTLVFAGNRTHHGMATVSYEGSTTRTTRLRLRDKPNQGGRSLVAVTPGMRASLVGQNDTWIQVDIDGWHGYIRRKFLTFDADAYATAAPSATPLPPVVNVDAVDVITVMLDDE